LSKEEVDIETEKKKSILKDGIYYKNNVITDLDLLEEHLNVLLNAKLLL